MGAQAPITPSGLFQVLLVCLGFYALCNLDVLRLEAWIHRGSTPQKDPSGSISGLGPVHGPEEPDKSLGSHEASMASVA